MAEKPECSDALSLPNAMDGCRLCPRQCGARRTQGRVGVCGADDTVRVARAALHFWEEPPLSGERGSGAIFFAHCPLGCLFCQNARISAGGWGKPITCEGLIGAMLDLQAQGAHNINLVTATHYAPQVRAAVLGARERGLRVPVVYNSSGYELPQTIWALEHAVNVWLPDFKYADTRIAAALSRAADYPAVALDAIEAMVAQVDRAGGRLVNAEGLMERGVIVRHLVLPGQLENSYRALDLLWERFGNAVDVSVMSQYTPPRGVRWPQGFEDLERPLWEEEYELVLDHSDDLGFENLWWQQGDAVGESFIPDFDGTGVPENEEG